MVTSQKILSAVRGNWLLNAAGLVLSFRSSVVLVRAIPPGLYAQYAAVLAIVGVATLVFEAGAREAMSCGRPCLVANDDFRETLGRYEKELLFRGGDPTDLARKLRSLLNRTSAQRNEIGLYLRERWSDSIAFRVWPRAFWMNCGRCVRIAPQRSRSASPQRRNAHGERR